MTGRKESEHELVRTLRKDGWFTYKMVDATQCPRCGHVGFGAQRPADMYAMQNGMARMIEVKSDASMSFQFMAKHADPAIADIIVGAAWPEGMAQRTGLAKGQRMGLEAFEQRNPGCSFVALMVGTALRPKEGEAESRRFYLIPWSVWKTMELALISQRVFTIPSWRTSPATATYNLGNWGEPYRLPWKGNGIWQIPTRHPFLSSTTGVSTPVQFEMTFAPD